VDNRGRWKRQRRTVDTYIDVYLPFPEAKVRILSLFLFQLNYYAHHYCFVFHLITRQLQLLQSLLTILSY
jgi:hypothetical protein